jgi:hypothetical protein
MVVVGLLFLFMFTMYSLSSYINCQDDKGSREELPEIPGLKFVRNVVSWPFIMIERGLDYWLPVNRPLPPPKIDWHDLRKRGYNSWKEEEDFWKDKP